MNTNYVGVFRCDRSGCWSVTFPDLPGVYARGYDFPGALDAAAMALAAELKVLDAPPRARSAIELTMDAAADPVLSRSLVNAVMHSVLPADRPMAPAGLVAQRGTGAAGTPAAA